MASAEENKLEILKDEVLMLIGKRIQSFREELGLSQVDLAGKVIGKIDTTNISRIESGRTNVTIYTLIRISIALEISLEDLVKDIPANY